jgi:hypothetical protein
MVIDLQNKSNSRTKLHSVKDAHKPRVIALVARVSDDPAVAEQLDHSLFSQIRKESKNRCNNLRRSHVRE